ncbi:hypothetical protein IQ249_16935 [Lusitaniella coriacea LEGE 07157]|uniref:Polysaccharide pyruvyl transferase domain-containing protein n=1 Tax=Lusitaniella coriacea LEGE 07157 TaxID=945747 RepID=A0A8J7JCQ2_9CYAN|nr:polysaccharide pyruvyl transferase family protein [Lusitaniella coriacea]MBE9117585.1 hypothetical protein [Lusitaniella coriacea LEGE 07157]
MDSIINCHVIDPKNIGDLLSCPLNYFTFPGYHTEKADIRQIDAEAARGKHLIIGGGGLLYSRFLTDILNSASHREGKKLIAWGIGQQVYKPFTTEDIKAFDYSQYLDDFDLIGIRDIDTPYNWVPCASCMHSAFDKKREVKHEYVVFSHKKFQIKIDDFPRITNESKSFEEVLDFLGSGETILTSSYHGAYWGTLLGRKVLAFPFSSKFYTLKHKPAIHPLDKWRQDRKRFYLFNKLVYEFRYKNKFSCALENWQNALKDCQLYPESLEESRSRNQWYYNEILEHLAD